MATNESTPTTVSTTYNQPTARPTAKVAAVGVAGLASTALVWLALTVFGVEIPAEMADEAVGGVVALVSLITFVTGYFKKSNTK